MKKALILIFLLLNIYKSNACFVNYDTPYYNLQVQVVLKTGFLFDKIISIGSVKYVDRELKDKLKLEALCISETSDSTKFSFFIKSDPNIVDYSKAYKKILNEYFEKKRTEEEIVQLLPSIFYENNIKPKKIKMMVVNFIESEKLKKKCRITKYSITDTFANDLISLGLIPRRSAAKNVIFVDE